MVDISTHIHPGRTFRDTDGHLAQLHGVGILQVADGWYAWGEEKTHGPHFQGISCYTSGDLVQWTRQPDALPVSDGDLGPDKVVERPKVLRREDGSWIMLVHADTADYSYARVGYAIAETPAGPFRYVRSERPMGNLSRDIGVFQDESGSYLLSEDRDAGLRIYRLAEDLLSAESLVVTLRQDLRPELGYESPALVHRDGVFYVFGSDLTGWSTNDNVYATAPALTGPWSPWRTFAPTGTCTFDSQISTVVPIQGGHMYVGDRWNPDQLGRSAAVWLPLELAAGEARVHWRSRWHPEDVRR